jgi:D-alanyl-lipoteichoic acid acyltransferase DltB (MBOAT superfamily)
MDAGAFLEGHAEKPPLREWFAAIAKTALGATLYFGVARCFDHPLAAGWVGMCGVIFLLHFGGFHLLSIFWRTIGVQAEPIMRWPLAAQSLGDFWGRRWNLAFNELAERFVFRPSVRRLGVGLAGLAAFVASGVIHDGVISVPAWGGWGLPTAYFFVQGCGAMFERSRAGRRLGLRRGWRGRVFTIAIVAGPAFFLFHPPFVRNVIIPMMEATGAR